MGNTEAFPVLRHWGYFNHAGVCPLPRVAADAIRAYADEAASGSYLNTDWYPRVDRLRTRLAQLVHAERGEIALVKNTSEGIATVARGIRWRRGDRIVTCASEYPSNLWPWQDVAREDGAEVTVVPERTRADGTIGVDEEEILTEIDRGGVRLVALSHVQFGTGQRLDLHRIGAVCRRRGVLFSIDAIQSVGLMHVDVQALHADFLSADGHKWMLGPEGAGFLYVRKERLPELRTPMVGWNTAKNALAFDSSRFEPKDDASRFECGTLTIPAFLSLLASVELLLGVGLSAIEASVTRLTAELTRHLDPRWRVVTPSPVGIVSMTREGWDVDALKSLCVRLRKERRIELAVRASRLRASPHFYNTPEQMRDLASAIVELGG
jgi:selenocysteine lyase/cysteine desulfurase